MASLQPDLQNRLRNELLRCPQFGDNASLRAVFADARLSGWQHNVPEAANPGSRASALIAQFMDAWNSTNGNGLALAAFVLAELNDSIALMGLAGDVQVTLVRGKIAECERELAQVKDHQARGWSDPTYARRRVEELQSLISQWNLKLEDTMTFNQSGQAVKYQVNVTGNGNVQGNGNFVGVIGDNARVEGGLSMGGNFKQRALQQRYDSLLEEYESVCIQIDATLDEVGLVRLRRQSEHIATQLTALAEQLGIQNQIKQEKPMVNFTDFNTKALHLQSIRNLIALRKEFGLTVPEELLDEGRALRGQVDAAATAEKSTYAANLKRELRDVETAEEKRARLQKELKELGDSATEI